MAVTSDQRMPPWPPSTAEGGSFRDARVITEAERATLAARVEAGCPEGDPKDAWSPRKLAARAPSGTGRYLPAGADVLVQVHDHKDGKPETDATAIGLYFARGTVDKEIRGRMVTTPAPGCSSGPSSGSRPATRTMK